ncbi:MAG: hypothetical protein HZB51_28450 [Chloroflexi bacterium]|nr:hypothetical protein [Chloroflexota bacterium]
MELEQRVKALEYEMKILKNEVQRTLLDIQEQILVHYYPQLRIEETKPSDGTVAAVEAIRQRQAAQAPAPEPQPVAAATPAPAAATAPAIKKVSLDEIREAQTELAAEDAKAKADDSQKMLEALIKRAGSLEEALRLLEEAKRG